MRHESPYPPDQTRAMECLAMSTAAKKASAPGNATEAVSHLADVTKGMLMDRADALMGCTENSPEEAELAALTDLIEAYERWRWPDGKIPGGNG